MPQGYYIGTDLKFRLDIQAEGFDMDVDDYFIELSCGGKTVTIDKSSDYIVKGSDNNHYLLVDTTQFSSGTLKMILHASVQDEDFPGNVRREVAVMNICKINNT